MVWKWRRIERDQVSLIEAQGFEGNNKKETIIIITITIILKNNWWIERRIRAGRKRITNDDDEIYRSRTTSPGKKCRLSHDHPWYRNHSRFGGVRNRILKRNFTNTSPWGIRRVSCVGRIPPKRIMPVNWWQVVRCRRSVWMPQPNWQGKATFSGKGCFPGHRLPTDTSLYPPVGIPRYWWRCKRHLGTDFKDNLRTNWNRLRIMEYYVSWY